jgi:hypothetical protein
MQVDEIAKKIFDDAGFELVFFDLKDQFHYPASFASAIIKAGQQMAIIQVKDEKPTAFFFKAKPYSFTDDCFAYPGDETISSLLEKKSVESFAYNDGSKLYLFNVNEPI